MKITNITIRNAKSFGENEEVEMRDGINIFVGPNGGGKSNLLDIITVVLRRNFILGYNVEINNAPGGKIRNLTQQKTFQNFFQNIPPFSGLQSEETLIGLELETTDEDIDNLQKIATNYDNLFSQKDYYFRNDQLNWGNLRTLQDNNITSGQRFNYVIRNGDIENTDGDEFAFLNYLKNIEGLIILDGFINEYNFHPPYLFFSPYRAASPQDLQANLPNEKLYDQIANYFSATSRTSSSLLKIASLYFAQKKRYFQEISGRQDPEDLFQSDPEVVQITDYIGELGYSWTLKCQDYQDNIYEIYLIKGERTFGISEASSGEKEIFNFIFGIFAFNTKGGLILIDEPELHLHPKWQTLLRDIIDYLSKNTNNQFLLTTHSAGFIGANTLNSVSRVYKNDLDQTAVTSLSDITFDTVKDRFHLINSHNNERLFFSDVVILVEGIGDKIVFSKISQMVSSEKNISKIIDTLEVHGKHNFQKYADFLERIGVKYAIVADLDYMQELGGIEDIIVRNWDKIDADVLKNQTSKDRDTLAESIEHSIEEGDLEFLGNVWDYIKNRYVKIKSPLSDSEKVALQNRIEEVKSSNVYVLPSGEIEDYFPFRGKSLDNIIEYCKPEYFEMWLEGHHMGDNKGNPRELKEIVSEILDTYA